MAQQSDETRSVARSVSSMSNIEDSVAVEKYPPQFFWIVALIIETLQVASFSVHFDNWPITESFLSTVDQAFGYLSFGISWKSDAFIMVLFFIGTITTLILMVLLIIGTIFNRKEQDTLLYLYKVCSNLAHLLSSIFFVPFLTVFSGSFVCYGNNYKYEITCGNSARIIFTVFGIILILVHLSICLFVRLFIFERNFKKGGFFAMQSGAFSLFRLLFYYISLILYCFIGGTPYIPSSVGAFLFLCLSLYCLYSQPYFHPVGNALISASFIFITVTYIFGMVADLTEINVHSTSTGLLVLFWILFFSSLIGFPFLFFFITYKLAISRWAMRKGESIPYFKSKDNELTVLSSPAVTSPSSSSSTSAFSPPSGPTILSSNNPSSSSSSSSSDNQPKSLAAVMLASKKGDNNNNNNNKKKEDKIEELLPPKQLPKYIAVEQVQRAIRYLTVKDLQEKKECLFLAEDIMRYGQKKFPDSSSLFITLALYHYSFTDNSNKMGEALRSAKQCIPDITERFLIFALLRDLSRQRAKASGSGGDINMAFRLNYEKGTRAHETARAYLKQAYIYLSKDNKDLQKIMLFLEKAIQNEAIARETFEDMMKTHPNSVQLLRAFGALLRDIYREDDTATMMFTEANLLEEEQAQDTGGSDEYEEGMSRISGRSKLSSIAGVGGGIGQGGVGGDVDGNMLDDREKIKKKKKKKRRNLSSTALKIASTEDNLLPFITPTILISVFCIIACLVVSFVLVLNNFDNSTLLVSNIDNIASVMVSAFQTVIYSYFFQLKIYDEKGDLTISDATVFIPSWEELNTTMKYNVNKIRDRISIIYENTEYKDMLSYLEREFMNEIWLEYYRGDPGGGGGGGGGVPGGAGMPGGGGGVPGGDPGGGGGGEGENPLGPPPAGGGGGVGTFKDKEILKKCNILDLLTTVSYIGEDMVDFWSKDDVEKISYLYFLRANIPICLEEALKQLSAMCSERASDRTHVIVIVCYVLLVFTVIAPILVIIVQLLYTEKKLIKERKAILLDICCQPVASILQLKRRLDETETDDGEEGTTKDSMDGTATNNSMASKNADNEESSNNEDSEDSAEEKKDDANDNNNNNNKPSSQLISSDLGGINNSFLGTLGTPRNNSLIMSSDSMMKPGTAYSNIYQSGSFATPGLISQGMGADSALLSTSPLSLDGTMGGMLNPVGTVQSPPPSQGAIINNAFSPSLSRVNSFSSQAPLLGLSRVGTLASLSPLSQGTTSVSPNSQLLGSPGFAGTPRASNSGSLNNNNNNTLSNVNNSSVVNLNNINLNGSVVISNDMLGSARGLTRVGTAASLASRQGVGGMNNTMNSSITAFPPSSSPLGIQSTTSPLANSSNNNLAEDYSDHEEEGEESLKGKGMDDNKKEGNEDYEELDSNDHEDKVEEEDEDENREEMKEKILKMKGIIPKEFRIRMFTGMILTDIGAVLFYVISIYISNNAIESNNSIFLAGYRYAMGISTSVLSIILAVPPLPNFNFNLTVDYSTNPFWTGYEHMLQKDTINPLLSKDMQFFETLSNRLHYGSGSDTNTVTGDELVDSLSISQTLVEGSVLINLMYDQTNCLLEETEDCTNLPNRMYGIDRVFNGLGDLLTKYITSLNDLVEMDYNNITNETPDLQTVMTMVVYDLNDGMKKYKDVLEEEQSETLESDKTSLLLVFVIVIITSFIATLVGFFPIRGVLVGVARTTSKIQELNPSSDVEERTGMRQAAWKEEYSCDCNRTDNQHKRVLNRLALVCGAIDPEIDIITQLTELRTEFQERNNRSLKKTVTEASELCFGDASIGKNSNKNENKGYAKDDEKNETNKKKGIIILRLLKELVIVTFSSFHDEEHLMTKYKFHPSHTKPHFSSHASVIRSLQKQSLHIAKMAQSSKHNYIIPQNYAQELSQIYIGWLTDHVNKNDREFVAIVQGKAPPSELEKDVNNDEFVIPKSYAQFLHSDNASLQERSLFEKLKTVLKLEEN